MQLGIRLHDVEPGSVENRLACVRSKGFSCVQLALYAAIKEYSVDNSALVPGYAMHLKRVFAKQDIDIAVLGCYKNLGNPNPEQLKKIQETYYAHIRFASLLGCGVVGTETGAVNEEYVYEPACHSEEALAVFIKNLKPVVKCAESFGVIMAIEPVWNHIVCNSKRALKVLQEIDSPNLQIIFDPVNLLSIENYKEREEIFQEAIDLLGDYIAVVHLKDFCIVDNKITAVAAGEGLMDYKSVLSFLKKEKPFIQATLENTKPENAEKARCFLQDEYDKLAKVF
jgi:sugar phosphate isomerase/epimerase